MIVGAARAAPAREAELAHDDELVLSARADPAAFAVLYERYIDQVYRYCWARTFRADDAADISQQVFARALANIERYQPTKSGFTAWLFRIARNAATDHLRRRRTAVSVESLPEARHPPADVAEGPDEQFALKERLERLGAAVRTLKPEEQELIALHFTCELTVSQVAKIVGKSESATRMRIWRALRVLRKELET